MVLCSAPANLATNYDIFDIPLECLPFMQTTILKASLPILSPALEAHEKQFVDAFCTIYWFNAVTVAMYSSRANLLVLTLHKLAALSIVAGGGG